MHEGPRGGYGEGRREDLKSTTLLVVRKKGGIDIWESKVGGTEKPSSLRISLSRSSPHDDDDDEDGALQVRSIPFTALYETDARGVSQLTFALLVLELMTFLILIVRPPPSPRFHPTHTSTSARSPSPSHGGKSNPSSLEKPPTFFGSEVDVDAMGR